MAGYLVLMFFAAQFVAWFNYSQLGLLLAIEGAAWLGSLTLPDVVLLLLFLLLTTLINLLIGSASAKWSILAPIFVPMLMLLGISPEATQAAYRVGDKGVRHQCSGQLRISMGSDLPCQRYTHRKQPGHLSPGGEIRRQQYLARGYHPEAGR